jgi:hypothetical protein
MKQLVLSKNKAWDYLVQLMDSLNWRLQNEIDTVLAVSAFYIYTVVKKVRQD